MADSNYSAFRSRHATNSYSLPITNVSTPRWSMKLVLPVARSVSLHFTIREPASRHGMKTTENRHVIPQRLHPFATCHIRRVPQACVAASPGAEHRGTLLPPEGHPYASASQDRS